MARFSFLLFVKLQENLQIYLMDQVLTALNSKPIFANIILLLDSHL